MTRKDYEQLAEAIAAAMRQVRALETTQTGSAETGAAIVVQEITRALAADNPRFDAARFAGRIALLTDMKA